jgi:peptidoglycan LD-endopeptidase CwlK
MATFGEKSESKLQSCVPELQKVMREAIKITDFTVIFGHRTTEEQQALYAKGRKKHPSGLWEVVDKNKIVTQIDGVDKKGMHNYYPSQAIDIAPYPIDWSAKPKAMARFYLLAGVILAVAHELNIKLRWGGDWDGDWDLSDQTFDDTGHFEVKP